MKNFVAIEVSGKCFAEGTRLDLFPNEVRYAAVFGRNGSGKTTIAEGIRLATSTEESTPFDATPNGIAPSSSPVSVRFLGDEGATLDADQVFRGHTYVFDEAFVDAHVRDRTDGLESIVLLDEGGMLTDQIEDLKQQKAELTNTAKDLEAQVALYDSSEGEMSVAAARDAAQNMLKGNEAWAGRDKCIKRNSRNSSIADKKFDEIRKLALPEGSLAALLQDFNAKLATYLDLSDEDAQPLPAVPSAETLGVFDGWDELQPLLAQRIDSPEVTERDERIIKIVGSLGIPFITNAVTQLQRRETGYCPYCLRDIGEAEVADLAVRVERVLDDRVKSHQAALDSHMPQAISLDLAPYGARFPELVLEVSNLINAYNTAGEGLAEQVRRKRDNVYDPVVVEEDPLETPLGALSAALGRLADAVTDFNASLAAIDASRKELIDLNERIARLEMDSALITWTDLQDKRASAKAELAERQAALEQVSDSLVDLEARKKNIKVACGLINKNLAFIFMDKDHLRLREVEGLGAAESSYALYSNGKPARPDAISTGERNAVALCYFFANIGAGRHEKERFSDPCLVVLDDPISSFDYENKIGIHTFLRQQLGRVLLDNKDSKVLVMTHDAQSMVNFAETYLRSSCVEPWKSLKRRSKTEAKAKAYVLEGFQLRDWKKDCYSYTDQLNDVFNFVCDPAYEKLPYMGNTIRRVLEAFCTFEFKSGMAVLCEGERALSRVEDERLRECFAGYMGRLVLNDESHAQDAVNAEASIVTQNHYSKDELVRAGKISVCMLYSIDSGHVLSHLSCANAEETIQGWLEEFESLYQY